MKLRSSFGLLFLLSGCGSPVGPQASAPSAGPPHAAQSAIRPSLERRRTGQDRPSIDLRNAYPTTQHVFVDWVHVGRVEPAASASFELSVGTHTITSAGSTDPDHNPVSVTETFESGFAYTYQIVAD